MLKKLFLLTCFVLTPLLGESATNLSGETKKWHKISIVSDGPSVSENSSPNPFLNYRFDIVFTSPSGRVIRVPGFFDADGNSANTSATSGNKWRCNFNPDETGTWSFEISMRTGTNVSIASNPLSGSAVSPNGETGIFFISDSDKNDDGFRSKGRLIYVGEHYEIYAETGKAFLKAGPGSPENLLAYGDFDQTYSAGGFNSSFVHWYGDHIQDWRNGDPVWKGIKGKGLVGALNYLASKDCNTLYFMVHNRSRSGQGDGQDVWPWNDKNERQRFDVSKLAQWEMVLDHASDLGIRSNLFLQEIEIQDDMGGLDTERKLFFREMVSRFGHLGGLQWNLGEEDSQSISIKKSQADFIRSIDPYDHPIAHHVWFNSENDYDPLYGYPTFESSSFQGDGDRYDSVATEIRSKSSSAGRKWIAYGDEQDPDDLTNESEMTKILARNIFAGGGGCEYYAGNPETGGGSDLVLENFRNFDQLWTILGKMRVFIEDHIDVRNATPYSSDRRLSTSEEHVAYLQNGGSKNITVSAGEYIVTWFNAETGAISGGNTMFLSGSNNFSSPFGGNQAIIAIQKAMENDDADITDLIFPDEFMSGNPTNIAITVKNTGDTDWTRNQGYRLSIGNDLCGIFPDFIDIDNGITISKNQSYTFRMTVDSSVQNSVFCSVRFSMENGNGDMFGEVINDNFTVGPSLSVDFTNNNTDWQGFVIAGNASTSSGSNGLCMYAPETGNNISGWASPERYIELTEDTIYHVNVEAYTDQTGLNRIPLLDIAYDNFNSSGYGNIYGGEYFILDVGPPGQGGANGIGRQKSSFDVYFAPNASLTPQWAEVFSPENDANNDMRLIIRILDIGSSGFNADIDYGNICIKRITVTKVPMSVLNDTTVLFNDEITSSNFYLFSNSQNPEYAAFDEQNNLAEYRLDTTLDMANFFPKDPLYPVEWKTDETYIAKIDVQLSEDSNGFDPIDALFVNFDTATSELGQINFSTRGSPGNMEFAASPRKASEMGGPQTFICIFSGNNVTNIAGFENLRSWLSIANTPDLFLTGTGGDTVQVTGYSIEKINPLSP